MKNDFNLNNYKISLGTHRDKDVIFFEFPNLLSLRNQLRMKLKLQWSLSNKKWYALDMPLYLNFQLLIVVELTPSSRATSLVLIPASVRLTADTI